MAKVKKINKKKSFLKDNWLLILALIYVLSPIDFIPDALLPIGFGDDLLVLLLTLAKKYWGYKKKKDNIIEGEIIDE